MANVLRNLPSVSELLDSPPLKSLVQRVNRNEVVSRARQFLDDMRSQVQSAAANVHVPTASELAQTIADWIAKEKQTTLRPVINATGVLLHARLGRSPLAEEAIGAIAAVSRGYANVEMDLSSGERCERTSAVEGLLCEQTRSEAATVVNNNAAATLISLAALAYAREVIVSRGQLVEIGGGYRLTDVMTASGASLREVGTTNQTRIGDYASAIGPRTAAIMRVHASNYSIVGDSNQVSLTDLVGLARQNNLPLIHDLGSGALIDLGRYGVRGEPIASESVRAGADLTLFSGNKLLGGPQCGIIVGRRTFIEQIKQHSLMRAVQVDKLTLAALAATLRLYCDLELTERSVPLLTLLATPLENLQHRAQRLVPQLAATGVAHVEIVTDQAQVTENPLPQQAVPTVCIALTARTGTTESLATSLRTGTPAVIGRIHDGRLLLDLRSVQPRDDAQLVAALEAQRPPTATAERVTPIAPEQNSATR